MAKYSGSEFQIDKCAWKNYHHICILFTVRMKDNLYIIYCQDRTDDTGLITGLYCFFFLFNLGNLKEKTVSWNQSLYEATLCAQLLLSGKNKLLLIKLFSQLLLPATGVNNMLLLPSLKGIHMNILPAQKHAIPRTQEETTKCPGALRLWAEKRWSW